MLPLLLLLRLLPMLQLLLSLLLLLQLLRLRKRLGTIFARATALSREFRFRVTPPYTQCSSSHGADGGPFSPCALSLVDQTEVNNNTQRNAQRTHTTTLLEQTPVFASMSGIKERHKMHIKMLFCTISLYKHSESGLVKISPPLPVFCLLPLWYRLTSRDERLLPPNERERKACFACLRALYGERWKGADKKEKKSHFDCMLGGKRDHARRRIRAHTNNNEQPKSLIRVEPCDPSYVPRRSRAAATATTTTTAATTTTT